MRTATWSVQVNVPSLDEFSSCFPQYGPFARGDGNFLFELLTAPEAHILARVATEELQMAAVSGVAGRCHAAAITHGVAWTGFLKQFIGAVVCVSMEANGFRKSGTKRAIPHHAFTKGEFYQR